MHTGLDREPLKGIRFIGCVNIRLEQQRDAMQSSEYANGDKDMGPAEAPRRHVRIAQGR